MGLGVLGLVFVTLVIIGLKGPDNFMSAICQISSIDTRIEEPGSCFINVYIDACNTTMWLNHSSAITPSAGGLDRLHCASPAGYNVTCYTDSSCLADSEVFLFDPDPPLWATPGQADFIMLLIGIPLLVLGFVGVRLFQRTLLMVSRRRELPY